MSFYLGIWSEESPITVEDAERKYELLCESNRATPTRTSVLAFHDELTAMPARLIAEDVGVDDASMWRSLIHSTDWGIVLQIMWPRSHTAAPIIRELAKRHGLVCFDPQAGVVLPNAPGFAAAFTLSSENGTVIPDPPAAQIERAARKLSRNNYFLVVERADGWYVQVGYGSEAGVRPGCYALEYQEGSLDRHFRAETTDIGAVIRFLQEFVTGEDNWKRRHGWRPMAL